jgi:pimeloyl-ACP methyl ester carboxylesterase
MSLAADWRLSKTHESAGGMVAYDVLGNGPPVVLVHGTPSWSYIWRNVAGELAERFTVYVCDLLGYGTSEQREGQDVSLGAQTRMLVELLEHWDLDQPCIAGHDFGGAITLRLMLLEGRRFRRVALCDAVAIAPWITPFSRHVQRHLDAFATVPEHIHRQMAAERSASSASPPRATSPAQTAPGSDRAASSSTARRSSASSRPRNRTSRISPGPRARSRGPGVSTACQAA